jgi:1-acyl-sn-glycerol-3-phosphate acyltransferase
MRDSLPRRWARRSVTVTAVFLALAALSCLLPALLGLGLLVDLARRRPDVPALRLAAFLWCFLFTEAAGLIALGALFAATLFRPGARADATWGIQRAYAQSHWFFLRSLFGLRAEVEGAELAAPGPMVVLVRHASLVDVLVPAIFVAVPGKIRLRYALKRELLWQPCLDVAGHWLPNHFVARGRRDTAADVDGVRRLKAGLGPRDGVILFPEGTRASAERRARAIEKLPPGSEDRAMAERLRALMPVRPGGVLALLDAPPACDVVFIGHVGLEGLTQLGDIWRGKLFGRALRLKLWRHRAVDVPLDSAQRWAWVQRRWEELDAWVHEVGQR